MALVNMAHGFYKLSLSIKGVILVEVDLAMILNSYEWLDTNHLASLVQPALIQFRRGGYTIDRPI